MQQLEMTVTAKDWHEAKSILSDVGIDEKSKINYRAIDGLYIVSVEKDPHLTTEEYRLMRDNNCVSILSDSESRKRISEVLDKVYDVETQLRKLLLHVSDLVEAYFDILKNKYTQGYVEKKSISIEGKLDPITSHLTLGQMKDILGYDLSWSKRQLSAADIKELIDETEDFAKLRTRIGEKLLPKTIWDVIAANVLRCDHKWTDINGDLNKLKDFRDQSAHYQVITEEGKQKLLEKADHLLTMLKPQERKLTKSEQQNLSIVSESLTRIADQIKALTIPADYYQTLINSAMPAINSIKLNTSATEALAKVVQPSIDAQKMILESYGNLFNSYKSTWILDEEDQDSSEDSDEDEDTTTDKEPSKN